MKYKYLLFLYVYIALSLQGCAREANENPRVNPRELVGKYSNATDTLFITADGSYHIKTAGQTENGHWAVQDSHLTLIDSKKNSTFIKVIEMDGAYQLIILESLDEDPDEWDWSTIMKKEI